MTKAMAAIIPARSGSKSIANKNIYHIGGHPLIAYSIAAAKATLGIDRVIVSTDCDNIAGIAESYGAEIPFMRPKQYARDDSPDNEFLLHFFDHVPVTEVVFLRPTTPFRNVQFISQAIIDYHRLKDEISGLRSVHNIADTPYKLFQIQDQRLRSFFEDFNGITDFSNLPRQRFPKTYKADGHVDIVKRETLKAGSVYGQEIYAVVGKPVVDIDSLWDLEHAENQFNNQQTDFQAMLKPVLSYLTEVYVS